jgi:hypothetical protein
MDRWTRTAAWLSLVVTMYLILTEALVHSIELPGLGNIGFTLVFVLFAIFHCAADAGWKTTGFFCARLERRK